MMPDMVEICYAGLQMLHEKCSSILHSAGSIHSEERCSSKPEKGEGDHQQAKLQKQAEGIGEEIAVSILVDCFGL